MSLQCQANYHFDVIRELSVGGGIAYSVTEQKYKTINKYTNKQMNK